MCLAVDMLMLPLLSSRHVHEQLNPRLACSHDTMLQNPDYSTAP